MGLCRAETGVTGWGVSKDFPTWPAVYHCQERPHSVKECKVIDKHLSWLTTSCGPQGRTVKNLEKQISELLETKLLELTRVVQQNGGFTKCRGPGLQVHLLSSLELDLWSKRGLDTVRLTSPLDSSTESVTVVTATTLQSWNSSKVWLPFLRENC